MKKKVFALAAGLGGLGLMALGCEEKKAPAPAPKPAVPAATGATTPTPPATPTGATGATTPAPK